MSFLLSGVCIGRTALAGRKSLQGKLHSSSVVQHRRTRHKESDQEKVQGPSLHLLTASGSNHDTTGSELVSSQKWSQLYSAHLSNSQTVI